ncbi:hypothetical protein V1512DRAFT_56243 [Lipomyces arxii]|uniref:uncharacterized protein n=1 Tax=Lipomyces arxii TaxID=56418 RepID=UPI0034D008CD
MSKDLYNNNPFILPADESSPYQPRESQDLTSPYDDGEDVRLVKDNEKRISPSASSRYTDLPSIQASAGDLARNVRPKSRVAPSASYGTYDSGADPFRDPEPKPEAYSSHGYDPTTAYALQNAGMGDSHYSERYHRARLFGMKRRKLYSVGVIALIVVAVIVIAATVGKLGSSMRGRTESNVPVSAIPVVAGPNADSNPEPAPAPAVAEDAKPYWGVFNTTNSTYAVNITTSAVYYLP